MLWPGQENTIQKTIIWPWGQSPTKVITVRDTPPYEHAPTYQISLTYLERQKNYGPDKLRGEEAEEAEEKIRLKQYVSLHSKGRHNYMSTYHILPQKSLFSMTILAQGSRWRAIRAKKSPCGCSLRFVLVPKEKWKSPCNFTKSLC